MPREMLLVRWGGWLLPWLLHFRELKHVNSIWFIKEKLLYLVFIVAMSCTDQVKLPSNYWMEFHSGSYQKSYKQKTREEFMPFFYLLNRVFLCSSPHHSGKWIVSSGVHMAKLSLYYVRASGKGSRLPLSRMANGHPHISDFCKWILFFPTFSL